MPVMPVPDDGDVDLKGGLVGLVELDQVFSTPD